MMHGACTYVCRFAALLALLMTGTAQAGPESPTAKPIPTPPAAAAGTISRATGHAFREGLTAAFSADQVKKHTLTANDNGLLTTKEDGAFAPDFWAGQDADRIAALLSPLSPTPEWPGTLSIARRVFLSDTIWPQDDLLTATRIEKIIAFGAPLDAAHLYTHLAGDDPALPLLKQGIRAHLASGAPNVACVERMAHADVTDTNDPFWSETKVFCTALMANPTTPPQWPDSIQDLDVPAPPTLAEALRAYTQSGRLVPPTPTADPPHHPPLAAAEKGWGTVADLYRAQAAQAAPNADFINKIAALPADLPLRAHLLFIPSLERASPSMNLPATARIRVAALLLAADSPQAGQWVPFLTPKDQKNAESGHNPGLAALLILAQMRGHNIEKGPIPLSFTQLGVDKKTQTGKLIKNLSEMLDKPPIFIDTAPDVYEKSADSPSVASTVIDDRMLQKALDQARDDRQLGLGILASLLAVQNQGPVTIDPDRLHKVLQTLVALGLHEEARQIATPALIGVYLEGEQQNGTSRSSGTTETKPASRD